jgi:hypothetical protein
MEIILVILAAVFVGALAMHGYKQYKIRLRKRISQNEYGVAVTIWEYACKVKENINIAMRKGNGVLDYSLIAIPKSDGYHLSLELIGTYFRVHAVPDKYNKTGRLSFLTDNTLTVRAADHLGKQASTEDPEYDGEVAA